MYQTYSIVILCEESTTLTSVRSDLTTVDYSGLEPRLSHLLTTITYSCDIKYFRL